MRDFDVFNSFFLTYHSKGPYNSLKTFDLNNLRFQSMGSGIPELENRVTHHDIIKPS